jgi:RND family efflux transporter MFP subunit
MAMVTSIPVRMGDQVRKGQLLLEIDPQVSQGQLSQARGALGQAQAALSLAQRNFERFQALAEQDAASELELDMARMQYEQTMGAVEQAEGAVAAASAVASDNRVVAPFEGRVVRRMVEVGDLAAPGRPLLMLESSGARRLATFVPESLAARAGLQVGTELQVAIDSRPDLGRLQAQVVEMTPGADPASHSYQVKLALPAEGLPTGAAGRAWVPTEPESVVSVPTDSILRQGGMTLVVLRTDEGEASPRIVTLGRDLGDGRIEVLSGLGGGESLLVGLEVAPPAGALVEEVSS